MGRTLFLCVIMCFFSVYLFGQTANKDSALIKSSYIQDNIGYKFQLQQQLLLSNQQQLEINRLEQQKKIFEKQKQDIAEKEKQLLELRIQKKQAELETDRKAQSELLERNRLQTKLDATVKDKQITTQREEISNNQKWNLLLVIGIITVAIIALIAYYSENKAKRLNAVISQQHAELEKMSMVKDTILGVVSHDMRTPVNTLISFTELISEGDISVEKLRLYLDQINNTLHHTSSMMNNLLNWSASQMQGFKPVIREVDIHQISNNIIHTFSDRAGAKEIKLTNTITKPILSLADANMLDLIMRNLVSNALKYTPRNGLVTIGAEINSNNIIIYVTDTGIGMADVKMDIFNSVRIMQAESTPGTEKEKGTGLGLLLCKTFSGLMNARIRVQANKDGRGSRFELLLIPA